MDEPFSSLDLKLKNEMHGLFLQIWRQDKRTALFVTHDADEAVSLADRLVVLKGGKAVFDAEPQFSASDELKNKEELRKKLISVLLES